MSSGPPASAPADPAPRAAPHAIYSTRLEQRRAEERRRDSRCEQVANLRLLAMLVAALTVWLVFGRFQVHAAWLLGPGLGFLALVVWHERLHRAREEARRAAAYYERGLARLEERWEQAQGPRHVPEGVRARVEDAEHGHPYAADLDLFGTASLFERLCTVRAAAGEETLARWLLEPAPIAEVLARQRAVAELAPRVDLREAYALLWEQGEERRRETLSPEALACWGEAAPVLEARWPRWLAVVTSAVSLAALLAWGLSERVNGLPFVVSLGLVWALGRAMRARVVQVTATVEAPGRALAVVAAMVARFEEERFESPRLCELQAALSVQGRRTSEQVARLGKLVDLLNSQRSQFFAPLAFVLLWSLHVAYALERWRREAGRAIRGWLTTLGELEALLALSGYAYEHPDDAVPELAEEGPLLEGEALGHPLLPWASTVRNDVRLGGELQLLLVSGSNMSGKSTLLRTVGANVVLALAGAPVRAQRLRLSCLQVGATLRIQDSLAEGSSRFYAEITRLKKLVELADGPARGRPPLLFLLDEVLAGTNSHDRGIGAEAVLRGLLDRGAVGLCTTHDLALAQAADALGPRARNVHFEDRLEEGRLVFDYRMREGVVTRSNALELMRAVGLKV